jgi:hypothetical protein
MFLSSRERKGECSEFKRRHEIVRGYSRNNGQVDTATISGRGFSLFSVEISSADSSQRPGGTPENSPAFQRRDSWAVVGRVPQGRLSLWMCRHIFNRPLRDLGFDRH